MSLFHVERSLSTNALARRVLLVLDDSAIEEPAAFEKDHHWGYEDENGPHTWKGVCQTGARQSPVDIRASEVDFDPLPRIHFINYAHSGPITIENNGHSVMASGFDKWGDKRPYIYGGGLNHKYELVQYHIHWSQYNNSGSEHTVASLHYPAEIHFVHMKKGFKAGDKLEGDSIAVVGVFVALGNDASPLSTIEPSLRNVFEPGATTQLQGYQLMPLLPDNLETFYRYDGSLTTPTCDEAVVWTIMAEPTSITPLQLTKLRQIRLSSGKTGQNYRPTQPLNGRRIRFRPTMFSYDRNAASSLFSAMSFAALVLFALLSKP
uniref:Carbonic anhydrase n=1 Tax=Ascaris lumbricoides TaxID=6252 RepID=A0A9J2PCE3_ASCLU